MSWAKKTSNFIVIALVIVVVGCGKHVPSAQLRTVADDGYLLSFTRVNLVERESRYHFQLCRQQLEVDTEEQACFNPFEDVEGEPLVFTALPEVGNLRVKGVAGKALRYTAGTAVVLVFGALAFVLIPKAARLAFTKMFRLYKTSLSGKADDVIRGIAEVKVDKSANKSAKKIADKAKEKALKEDMDFDYDQHYKQHYKQHYDQHLKQVEEERIAAFSVFKSKPALFFTSLFIVEGTIKGWQFSYESGRDASKQLAKWGWGEKELELAEAYPFLVSSEGEPYRVSSVKQLLETLLNHQQLIFSAAYLREFDVPETDATDKNILNKNF